MQEFLAGPQGNGDQKKTKVYIVEKELVPRYYSCAVEISGMKSISMAYPKWSLITTIYLSTSIFFLFGFFHKETKPRSCLIIITEYVLLALYICFEKTRKYESNKAKLEKGTSIWLSYLNYNDFVTHYLWIYIILHSTCPHLVPCFWQGPPYLSISYILIHPLTISFHAQALPLSFLFFVYAFWSLD